MRTATIDGRAVTFDRFTIFTVEMSRNKKAYVRESEHIGNPFLACRLLRSESKGIRRRLLINGKPVARN